MERKRTLFTVFSALCMTAVLQGMIMFLNQLKPTKYMYNFRTLISINREETQPAYGKQHAVLYYNPFRFAALRSKDVSFEKCTFTNCFLTTHRKYLSTASAVVMDTRILRVFPKFKRPQDQVWIFRGHETQVVYYRGGLWSKDPLKSGFNWTMTHRRNSDIFLPYGKIVPADKSKAQRDWGEVMRHKKKAVAWVVSRCTTHSKRETYVKQLKNYIRIDIFGSCGKANKTCGKDHFLHTMDEQCFKNINRTYKFYLAFENSLCDDYVTEKFMENYNYDLILVARGLKEAYSKFPKGTFIDTNDFNSPRELGIYLKKLHRNRTAYINFLKRKSMYRAMSYAESTQAAYCNICERLNNLNSYRKQYPDISKFIFEKNNCHYPTDIGEIMH